MPGFLDILRGGLDTAGGIRAAKDKADETDLVNSANFMMRLRALQQQEEDRKAQEELRQAQTNWYNKRPDVTGIPTPKAPTSTRKHYSKVIGPDGSVTFVNDADPTDRMAPGIKAHIPLSVPRTHGMTAGQQMTNVSKWSDAILEQYDGDRSQAEQFLSTDPTGQEYAKRGVTPADLFAAEGRYRAKQAGTAGRIESSGMAPSPQAAAGMVPQLRTPRTSNAGASGSGGVVAGSSSTAAPVVTPSGRPDLAALQAKWDTAAQSLKSQGKQDAEIATILGARP